MYLPELEITDFFLGCFTYQGKEYYMPSAQNGRLRNLVSGWIWQSGKPYKRWDEVLDSDIKDYLISQKANWMEDLI